MQISLVVSRNEHVCTSSVVWLEYLFTTQEMCGCL